MLKLKLQYFDHLMQRADIWKDSDAGKDWGQEERGMTEDEMVGWHHWPNRLEFGWTPGFDDGQGGLVCCSSWGCKELDMTERLNWTERLKWTELCDPMDSAHQGSPSITNSSTLATWCEELTLLKRFLKIFKKRKIRENWRNLYFSRDTEIGEELVFSRSVVSNSLQPHELQHTRLPCPPPSPGVHSNSCPLSWRFYPTISSSVVPFSCLQSSPASGSFPTADIHSGISGQTYPQPQGS